MKLKKYRELFEFVNYLDEQELLEMSNVTSKTTGINDVVIWIGPNPKTHHLRIKVSNVPNRYNGSDCFVITIPDLEIRGNVDKSFINKDVMDKIFVFINKNIDIISRYSNYELSTEDLLSGLKKWNE